jgi:hypothetical protein
MVISVYGELLQYEEVQGDMVDRIKAMGVYHIFEQLHTYYNEEYQLFNKALFFILHAYSLKSKYHVLGQSWAGVKEAVAEKVGITVDGPAVERTREETTESVLLYSDLILLKSREVISTINKYLLYQGNKNFRHLCMLKDQYEQMVSGALDPIEKSSGEIDFDQKNRNRKYATEILLEIAQWEQTIYDNDKDLKAAMEELQNKKENNTQSLRVEDNK